MAHDGYAHVHRSDTSKRPFLSLDPVSHSLTEGTSIPEPSPSPEPPSTNPTLPTKTTSPRNGDARESPSHAGPLSSHPVTPIEPGSDSPSNGFPFARSDTNAMSNLSRPHSVSNDLDKTINEAHQSSKPSELTQHQHNNTVSNPTRAESPAVSSTMQTPSSKKERRFSLTNRFMRFRSISSLRRLGGSKNDLNSSNASLSHQQSSSNLRKQYADQDSGYGASGASTRMSGDQLRGTKRPGSPSLESSSDMGPPKAGRPRANSASLPQLLRKKSMEWIGSARRRSGMWAESDERRPLDVADFDDDHAQSKTPSKLKKPARPSSSYEDSRSNLGRYSTTRPYREPPPTIAELGDFGEELDSHAMFASIGK